MKTYFKDPAETTDWVFDWSTWLDTGETISSTLVSVPIGLTLGDGGNGAPAPSHDNTTVTFWLSAGTEGQKYRISNSVTTSAGRTSERSIVVWVTVR